MKFYLFSIFGIKLAHTYIYVKKSLTKTKKKNHEQQPEEAL